MVRGKQFKEGDKVFAKVKGYPAWPAVIVKKTNKKFNVQFYGTGETGAVKPDEIFYFLKNRDQMIKGSKKQEFKDAIEEIEKAIAEAGGTDGDEGEKSPVSGKRKRSMSDKAAEVQPAKKSGPKSIDSDRISVSSESVSFAGTAGDEPISTKVEVSEATYTDKVDSNNAIDNEVPVTSAIKLVSEANLKNWIIYSDYVKENPELYKNRPADCREYTANQSFPLPLPTKKYVGLKLHDTFPVTFSNEYDNAMYDLEVASKMLTVKDTVTSGEVTPESDPDLFTPGFNLSEAEVKRDVEMKLINSKYRRVERLRNEAKMIEMDAKIKNCLGLRKAEPQKALGFLETMLELTYDEIMLKKHSHVVELIRKLRKYVGNVLEWSLPQSEVEVFTTDAKKIREKADEVYRKLKKVVTLPTGVINFWEGFNDLVVKFKEECRGLSNREVFTLCGEPYSRQAIIDRLEQSEELEEAEISQPPDEEVEKENSSEVANSESKSGEGE